MSTRERLAPERLKHTFSQISEYVSGRFRGVYRDRSISIGDHELKAEMRRIWGDVNGWMQSGNFNIASVNSQIFSGVFPLVVQKGEVLVAEKIGSLHEPSLFGEEIDLSEIPVGGFLWKFAHNLKDAVRERGVFEPDDGATIPTFPLSRLISDKEALLRFLDRHGVFVIHKAEYTR